MLPKKKPKLTSNKKNTIKKYKRVVFVYIAARNDLYIFSITNKRQMTEVGLNENLAIVIDYHELGKRGVQRYLIEKNNPVLIYQDARNVDSGDTNTLIDFIRWGVATFDAENYGLVMWDHATSGFLDPNLIMNREEL